MQMALRGIGAMVVNADGTISVSVDPNATSNLNPIVTPNPRLINYGAMPCGNTGLTQAECDAIQADLSQLAPGSAMDSPAAIQAAQANLQAQALGLAPISPASPTSYTPLVWIGLAAFALFAFGGRR
jgi:hypothetical protein